MYQILPQSTIMDVYSVTRSPHKHELHSACSPRMPAAAAPAAAKSFQQCPTLCDPIAYQVLTKKSQTTKGCLLAQISGLRFAVNPSGAFTQPHCTSNMGQFSSSGCQFLETDLNVLLLLILQYTDIFKAQIVLFCYTCASFQNQPMEGKET